MNTYLNFSTSATYPRPSVPLHLTSSGQFLHFRGPERRDRDCFCIFRRRGGREEGEIRIPLRLFLCSSGRMSVLVFLRPKIAFIVAVEVGVVRRRGRGRRRLVQRFPSSVCATRVCGGGGRGGSSEVDARAAEPADVHRVRDTSEVLEGEDDAEREGRGRGELHGVWDEGDLAGDGDGAGGQSGGL